MLKTWTAKTANKPAKEWHQIENDSLSQDRKNKQTNKQTNEQNK